MDVDEDARTIGAQLRRIRKSRRKSLVVVTGLAGMSKSQLSRIERGEIALDRRSEIVALANVLGTSPSEVTRLPMPTPGNGDVDARVKALRLTIQRVSFESPGGHVVPVEALRERVHSVLAAHNRCEHQAVGAALPALVADLHTSVAAGRDVAELLALAALLHVNGTHSWLRSAGANNDLCFDAARLGREAAQELGDPVAVAVAAFGSANGLIASGDFDLARIELDRLDLAPTSPATEQLAGALAVTRSLLAAARKEPSEVAGPLDMAAELAERTGEQNAYYLGFGPASVGVWRMSVALESGDHSRAAAVAETIRPESLATPTPAGHVLDRLRPGVGSAAGVPRRRREGAAPRREDLPRQGTAQPVRPRRHRRAAGPFTPRLPGRAGAAGDGVPGWPARVAHRGNGGMFPTAGNLRSSIVIEIPDFPETPRSHREPGRIQAQVQPIDGNNDHSPLIFTHEADGSWTIHGLGALRVTLPAAEMVALAESILGPCPVSAPHPWGVLHLLVADDGLTEGHVYRCYPALCGALLPTSKLPPATCPDDCELDVLYCSECVRTAAQWTAEAQQAQLAPETPR